jgi:hypothetical protein
MVSTARQKSRLPSDRGKSKKAWKRYEEIVASITPSTQGSPSADQLFDFMFTTDKVSSQIAEESENLLTIIMEDDKLWAWTEVDSPSAPIKPDGTTKIVGALGLNPENTSSFSVVDLEVVHERWKSAAEETPDLQHPLIPIIQAWLDLQAT